MNCPVCGGTGMTSMQRDGQPIECRRCRGQGEIWRGPEYERMQAEFTIFQKDDPR